MLHVVVYSPSGEAGATSQVCFYPPLRNFQSKLLPYYCVMGKTALLVVDIQHDFLPPDGSLAVTDGDKILPPVYRLLDEAESLFDLVVASLVS
jgi:hypothetical protein